MLVSHEELAQKVLALERRYDGQFLDDPDWLTLDDLLPPLSPEGRGQGEGRGRQRPDRDALCPLRGRHGSAATEEPDPRWSVPVNPPGHS